MKMRLFFPKYLLLILLFLLFSPAGILAQKKDSLKLACLLDNSIESAPEKPSTNKGPVELKIVLSSATDTVVKACTDARVSNVERDEEGKWDVVFFQNNYFFWLTGLSKALVKKNQKIKTGEPIGYLQPGEKIELLLYDFETPLDPKKYMKCGK
jgi:murein DD-endopeptidase MepM/ murein hydrolase activator NlpD